MAEKADAQETKTGNWRWIQNPRNRNLLLETQKENLTGNGWELD
jgi:hypothetical protein